MYKRQNYVSYFLNYMEKHPEELTCQDVRDFLIAKKDDGLRATTLNLYNSAIRFFYRNVLHVPVSYTHLYWMHLIIMWFLRFRKN